MITQVSVVEQLSFLTNRRFRSPQLSAGSPSFVQGNKTAGGFTATEGLTLIERGPFAD
jgi:hypothetical protein